MMLRLAARRLERGSAEWSESKQTYKSSGIKANAIQPVRVATVPSSTSRSRADIDNKRGGE
jgi:hypothetical protein